jgi:hypothetical protein
MISDNLCSCIHINYIQFRLSDCMHQFLTEFPSTSKLKQVCINFAIFLWMLYLPVYCMLWLHELFFSPAKFHLSPLIFKFSPQPPLFCHPPIFLPLRCVRSRPTISCELGGCSHFVSRTTEIKISGDARSQHNSNGWHRDGNKISAASGKKISAS